MWYLTVTLVLIAGCVGFVFGAWMYTIPVEPIVSHEHCDDRFECMVRKYTHTIQTLEAEVQNLIHGGNIYSGRRRI